MGIIAKTGEKVIVVDGKTGEAFVLQSLTEYEKSVSLKANLEHKPAVQSLTASPRLGSIDTDAAILQEVKKTGTNDWGGDEVVEEDRYYMEPTE